MRNSRNRWIRTAVLVGVSSISGVSAFATDNVWTGAQDNNWNNPNNWSLGRVPVNPNGQVAPADTFDDAVVNTNTGNIATITADIPVPRDIILGSGAGTNGQLNQTAGLAVTGEGNWFYVGRDAGTATYNLTGSGSLDVGRGNNPASTGGRLYVGGTEFGAGGATGTFNVNTTGTINVRNDLNVGTDGSTGVMTVDAGTITTGGWNFIGKHQNAGGANGTLTMNGGVVNNGGRTYVAHNGGTTGVMNLQGGSYNNGDNFIIGEAAGSSGTVNVTSAASTLSIGNELWVGQAAGGNGAMTVSAGSVTTNNWIAVGREGATGVLTVNGTGSVTKNGGGNITIGTGANGHGTVNVSSGGSLTNNGDMILGENDPTSVGIVNQSGGTVHVTGTLDVQRTGVGTYNLSGGTLSVDTNIDTAAGTLAFTGGKITRNGAGAITVTGDLTTGGQGATLGLDNGKTLAVSGTLNVAAGSGFDLTGDTIPAGGAAVTTGSIALGTDGGIVGTFGPGLTTITGLNNAAGATFISETQGESSAFNSNTQSVFWIQEASGALSLQYSLAPVPEPTSLGLIGLSTGMFFLRRRRKVEAAG